MTSISDINAQKVLDSIIIPPRPTVLVAIMDAQREEKGLQHIAQLISMDISLSAAVLKTINSAFYGLRDKVTSIDPRRIPLGHEKPVHTGHGTFAAKCPAQHRPRHFLRSLWTHRHGCRLHRQNLGLRQQGRGPSIRLIPRLRQSTTDATLLELSGNFSLSRKLHH